MRLKQPSHSFLLTLAQPTLEGQLEFTLQRKCLVDLAARCLPRACIELSAQNPLARYYGDFASPLMFVISLAQLYAWTGDAARSRRSWDAARRVLDWPRTYGNRDGDGYLEYRTQAVGGPKNQGWKDSGNGIVYEDGRQVPPPIATCEAQGYWFAAQELAAVLSWILGYREDAKALWRSALDLKERFNRDWWMPDERFVALALDPRQASGPNHHVQRGPLPRLRYYRERAHPGGGRSALLA